MECDTSRSSSGCHRTFLLGTGSPARLRVSGRYLMLTLDPSQAPPRPNPHSPALALSPQGPPHLASSLEYCGHGHPTSTLGTLICAHSSQVMVTPRWLPPSEPCCSPPGHPCFHLPPLSPPQPHQPPVAQGPAPPVPTYLLPPLLEQTSSWGQCLAQPICRNNPSLPSFTLFCTPCRTAAPGGKGLWAVR